MRIVCIYLTLVLFVSCSETPVLEESLVLPDGIWRYDQTFDFPIQVDDISEKYRLEMALTHTTEYDFQNIYTRIKTVFPNSKSATDTVSIQLSDKYGRWFANCNSKDCAYRVVLKDSFNFAEAGKHNLQLEQYSRTGYLEGVEEIGFALYKY